MDRNALVGAGNASANASPRGRKVKRLHRRQVTFLQERRVDADAAIADLVGEQVEGAGLDVFFAPGKCVEPTIDVANAAQAPDGFLADARVSGGQSARECPRALKGFDQR